MSKYRIASVAALLMACSSGADYLTGPATIGGPRADRIVAPDSVKVHTPFIATVRGVGSIEDECNRPAGVKVTEVRDVVRIEMFYRYPQREITCPSVEKQFAQTVSLRLSTPGIKTLRLIGAARWVGPGSPLDSVQRTITVVP